MGLTLDAEFGTVFTAAIGFLTGKVEERPKTYTYFDFSSWMGWRFLFSLSGFLGSKTIFFKGVEGTGLIICFFSGTSSLEILRFLLQGINYTLIDGDLYLDVGFECICGYFNSKF